MAVKQAGGLPTSEKKKPIAVISPQKKEKLPKSSKTERLSAKDSLARKIESANQNRSFFYVIAVVLIAFGFASLHMYHVSTMFENDRHFSHLSNLEREMTFRTEMGLYYFYYKTIVEAPTFSDGLVLILNDNVTEYPSVINTLKRFNLYPEIVIGAAYRLFAEVTGWLQIPTKQCWQVERGSGLPPILSCEGIGDPMYFYLQAVWICAGLTAALIFIFGTFLSRSALGGLIAILCFFFNHGESTRVQWTPPLRESFAYPFLLAQMLSICVLLRDARTCWKEGLLFATMTVCSLVTWQFSQFVLATQVVAVLILFAAGIVRKHILLLILLLLAAAVHHSLLLLVGNELLASSFLVSLLAASLLAVLLLEPAIRRMPLFIRGALTLVVCSLLAVFLRSRLSALFSSNDDAHILNLLRAKLGSYKDFHTLLYTCSPEFDFLPLEYFKKISETLLMPTVSVVLLAVVVQCITSVYQLYYLNRLQGSDRKSDEKTKDQNNSRISQENIQLFDTEVLYFFIQTIAFAVMALMVMRLKLFLTPNLCILASLLASRKFFQVIKSQTVHWAIVAVVLSGMCVRGFQNISHQRSIMGEYSNVALEQLLEWVEAETPKDAVFAGPMPVMANLLLSTRRPIVNHPHYEDAGLRERTKNVYTIFSRRTPQEVYKILSHMRVQFVVLEESWCFRESRPGCAMVDLWDVEEPENRHQPPLCPRLFLQSSIPFEKVYSNSEYVVLWLHSQYVELSPMKEYKL
ncbi:probable C-mannosyltransferase DPY19L1 [Neocloeon triangulifer]|uniref:probable C-mannosyltransferase DPY19L1 n=1 Tax=Neocloeon triangulifer TaxID=2078957 RepID=UPI00286FA15E|nr:probable C-mannosyltransferase DPY19L1 [Neocloeon triangulifer]